MQTYGVICLATGFVVYLGHADNPMDACKNATKDTGHWGHLGPFQQSWTGSPGVDESSWLELAVYDVTGILEPNPDVEIEDEAAHEAMNEDTLVDNFAARQLG